MQDNIYFVGFNKIIFVFKVYLEFIILLIKACFAISRRKIFIYINRKIDITICLRQLVEFLGIPCFCTEIEYN